MRLRITFSKTGALRYTGHLDLHKIWERTARRAGLPLAYSQGFHPQPKLQLAAALPLGFSARLELLDIWLDMESADSSLRLSDIQTALQKAAPPGLGIVKIEEVDTRLPALQTQVVAAEYEVTLLETGAGSDLTSHLSAMLETASLPRQRRGKAYDLKPLIETLSLLPSSSAPPIPASPAPRLFMRLSAREGATGRPEEVLDTLGIAFENTRIERTRLILKSGVE
jgi:radical SAM-linked protein